MSKIRQLSLEEIHKIAAGQVIERPLNVVKELIENAVDAHASAITITIVDGGKQKIEVVDDGCGMDSVDAKLCFSKHATSKITTLEDIIGVVSFGFRGEALAAMQAIARVTLITKEHGSIVGAQVISFEGQQTITQAAASPGTVVQVYNLFETIPARKKFLKSASTETRAITQLINVFSLLYPEIGWQLIADGESIINAPAQKDMQSKAAFLFEPKLVDSLMVCEHTYKNIVVQGLISDHQYMAYDRSQIMIVVNNRWIKNQQLTAAAMRGYRGILPDNKFPFVFLSITIDPALVDVNIHPKKDDVGLVSQKVVELAIQEAISNMLVRQHMAQVAQIMPSREVPIYNPAHMTYWDQRDSKIHRDTRTAVDYTVQVPIETYTGMNTKQELSIHEKIKIPQQQMINVPVEDVIHQEQSILQHDIKRASIGNFIGVYKHTYLLFEVSDGLLCIDQHAAHERVLYEKYIATFANAERVSLLFTQIITLSSSYMEALRAVMYVFEQEGFQIEQFGPTQIVIQSVPLYAQNLDLQAIIHQVLDEINEESDVSLHDVGQTITHKLRAVMACKAAVKAGDRLTESQIMELVNDLYQCKNPTTCPHQRPTLWVIKHNEFERKFKRS